MPFIRLAFVCLLSLFLAVSVGANETEKVPSLENAKTMEDIWAYHAYAIESQSWRTADNPTTAFADIYISIGERIWEIAPTLEDRRDKRTAFELQLHGLRMLTRHGGAEQRFEEFFKKLKENSTEIPAPYLLFLDGRFTLVTSATGNFGGDYNEFRSEFIRWSSQKEWAATEQFISNRQFIEEMMEFIPTLHCTELSESAKEKMLAALVALLRRTTGNDLKLYGRTLDSKDFDWQSLREKYVLIKFTATWCAPCKREIPGLLDAYEKYRDKGFEIVSVYVGERVADPVAAVKKQVEEEKLPWIIISETLTEQAGQPKQGKVYDIHVFPTMLLVDKEGKIIMTGAHGNELKVKLTEIFE
jgi:thiol-disulfide isomerase/thioredoxin